VILDQFREPRQPEIVAFDPARAVPREVDPAELIGKIIKNIYPISGRRDYSEFDESYPGSYGMAFADGSKYHIRILGGASFACVEYNGEVDDDDLEGRRVVDASLLEYSAHEFMYTDFFSFSEDSKHVALGIKLEGDERWHRFDGGETNYDSDGGLSQAVYHDLYLIKVHGPSESRRRGGGRGRQRGRGSRR
jgi:hypothetical protein